MVWLNRHLNWSYMMGLVLLSILLGLVMWNSKVEMGELLVWFGAYYVVLLALQSWFLTEKSRSLWFLLLNLVPSFGSLLCLALENKRDPTDDAQFAG